MGTFSYYIESGGNMKVYEVLLVGIPEYQRSFGLFSTEEKANIAMSRIHTEEFLEDSAYGWDYNLTIKERPVDIK